MIPWFMTTIILPILSVAVVLTFVRLARGPSIPYRVIAFDLLATLGIGILAAYSAATGETA